MNHNTPEFRRGLKQRTPKTALQMEHTAACRVLPDRLALLAALPPGGVVAEVGVAFGDYTAEILRLNQPRKLHLVDVWGSARYQAGLDSITAAHAETIAAGGIEINRGLSVDVLPTFADDYFDWIYIDTDHSYDTTYRELVLGAAKVKPGGFIAGHDFCTGNIIAPWPYGVTEACNQFCVDHGWGYRFLTLESHGHLSFALSRL